jgi:plastocyanin
LRAKTRELVVAAACGIAVGVPALAYGRGDPVVTISATGSEPNYAWDQPDVTIAPGDTVKFSNTQTAMSAFHNVTFADDSPKPATCTQTSGTGAGTVSQGPMPSIPRKNWTGECRFDAPGRYEFFCATHPYMTGTIRVVAAATPTPSATATPGASPTPAPGPGPGGSTGGTNTTQTTLAGAVTIARSQKGTRVRGSVEVKLAGSRLEISLWVPRKVLVGGKSSRLVRIGRSTRTSTSAGKVNFAVGTDAKARSALRRHRRLSVTVSIALTPPGGHKLTRSVKSTLRAS